MLGGTPEAQVQRKGDPDRVSTYRVLGIEHLDANVLQGLHNGFVVMLEGDIIGW